MDHGAASNSLRCLHRLSAQVGSRQGAGGLESGGQHLRARQGWGWMRGVEMGLEGVW